MNKIESHDDTEQITSTRAGEIGALEALWSIFSSMKTAVVLLPALVIASIVGTVIEDKTGVSIYGSTWFSIILLLVGINLAVCSINRFGLAWKRTVTPDVVSTPDRVAGMSQSEKLNCSCAPEEAAGKVIGALRRGSYRLVKKSDGDAISIYAAKGRARVWGPYLTHVSILVIFAGAIFGNALGLDGYTTIVEGKRATSYFKRGSKEKSPLGFEVALRNFTIKHDSKHNPTGYKSDLQVYDGGKAVTHKIIDVNHPLAYKGMSFFQSDYGLVGLVVKVTAPNGESAYIPYNVSTQDGERGRMYVISDEPWKRFALGGKNLTLFVHNLVPDYIGGSRVNGGMLPLNPAVDVMINDRFPEYKGLDAWKRLGWMTVSQNASYKGYTVTLQKAVSYTGLQVSRNPGLPVIYLGFALMVLGVFMSFYVTHKVVRVSISQSKDGATVIMGATSGAELAGFDKEFNRVREALA
ncbi:MAG: cytochrome c biogenesis protein ResB [Armatimonadota bacterium]